MQGKVAPVSRAAGGDGGGYGATLTYSQEQEQERKEQKDLSNYTGYKTFFVQNMGSSMTISISQPDTETSFCAMSTKKKICFYTFFFVDFCAGTFYSLLGPFFPNEAREKGINYTLTGFVFSVYPVVYIIVSPLVGRYLSKIGVKFVFITGIAVCGTCAILFGLLEYVVDGTTYAIMCIVVRAFQATGGVAFNTATFAMVAILFPAQMATMFGLLEVAFGMGTMLGPPVGGWMYEVGGFKLPFIVSGTTLLCMGVVCFYLVPGMRESQSRVRSMWSILLNPLVVLVGLTGATGTSGIGFLDVTLSIRLNTKFSLTPGWTGLVFFIAPFMFILSAPVWGRLADKRPAAAPFAMGFGTLIGGAAFWFMGPAAFLNLPDDQLWFLMVSYGVMGLAIGTHVVNGKIMAEEARRLGYPKNLETMGMLAGLITSFNSVGSFSGPLIGGYLNDRFNFPGATTVVGTIVMSVGFLLLLCLLIQCLVRRQSPSSLHGESSMLLSDDSQEVALPPPEPRPRAYSSGPVPASRDEAPMAVFIRKRGHSTSSPSSLQVGSLHRDNQIGGIEKRKLTANEPADVSVDEEDLPTDVEEASVDEKAMSADEKLFIDVSHDFLSNADGSVKENHHNRTPSSKTDVKQNQSGVVTESACSGQINPNLLSSSESLNKSELDNRVHSGPGIVDATTAGSTGHLDTLPPPSTPMSGRAAENVEDLSTATIDRNRQMAHSVAGDGPLIQGSDAGHTSPAIPRPGGVQPGVIINRNRDTKGAVDSRDGSASPSESTAWC